MPKPHIFETRAHLVKALQAQSTLELAESFFANRSTTLTCVARDGVGGNTFRAFRNLPVRPSVAFRTWITDRLEQTLPALLTVTDAVAYAAYVHHTTLALNEYWRVHTGGDMGYGRGAKLLNLVLKKLICYVDLADEQRTLLISLLHVPLDSFTIVGLRNVARELTIPKSATMKYITTPEQYAVFQEVITAIALEAGVPRIYYDILAWDIAH